MQPRLGWVAVASFLLQRASAMKDVQPHTNTATEAPRGTLRRWLCHSRSEPKVLEVLEVLDVLQGTAFTLEHLEDLEDLEHL